MFSGHILKSLGLETLLILTVLIYHSLQSHVE